MNNAHQRQDMNHLKFTGVSHLPIMSFRSNWKTDIFRLRQWWIPGQNRKNVPFFCFARN